MQIELTEAIAMAGLSIAGGFAIFGLFDQRAKKKKKMEDDADDRLINLLQQTVGELEKKVTLMEADQRIMTDAIKDLKSKNQTLLEVLQGRDNNTKEFNQRMLEAAAIAEKANTQAEKNGQNIKKLVDLLERHLSAIERKIQ